MYDALSHDWMDFLITNKKQLSDALHSTVEAPKLPHLSSLILNLITSNPIQQPVIT